MDIKELQKYCSFDIDLYIEKGDRKCRVVQEVWEELKRKVFSDGYEFLFSTKMASRSGRDKLRRLLG